MKIDFTALKEKTIQQMNGGNGKCRGRMFMDEKGKIIYCILPQGSSIGSHVQKSSNDVNYVISGQGKAICDGIEETLAPGDCHYCPKGSTHSIINMGEEDLVLFSVVTEL